MDDNNLFIYSKNKSGCTMLSCRWITEFGDMVQVKSLDNKIKIMMHGFTIYYMEMQT